jgi:ribose 5-phosphate isomerase
LSPPLNHHVHIGLGQGSTVRQAAMAQGREERGIGSAPSRDAAIRIKRPGFNQ